MMNLNDLKTEMLGALTRNLDQDDRVQLVLTLAKELRVEDKVVLAENAVIANGDTVATSQGAARAIVITPDDVRSMARITDALKGQTNG